MAVHLRRPRCLPRKRLPIPATARPTPWSLSTRSTKTIFREAAVTDSSWLDMLFLCPNMTPSRRASQFSCVTCSQPGFELGLREKFSHPQAMRGLVCCALARGLRSAHRRCQSLSTTIVQPVALVVRRMLSKHMFLWTLDASSHVPCRFDLWIDGGWLRTLVRSPGDDLECSHPLAVVKQQSKLSVATVIPSPTTSQDAS